MKHEQALQRYREHFDRFERALNGESNTHIHAMRREALSALERIGFPTLKQEDWRYTNIGPLLDADMVPSTPGLSASVDDAALEALRAGLEDAIFLVFIDGNFSPSLSKFADLPDGLTVQSIDGLLHDASSALPTDMRVDASEGTQPFPALNGAFLTDGAVIRLRRNIDCERVVHILYFASSASAPLLIQPRLHIVAEEGSALRIVEQYASSQNSGYFTNAVVTVEVGPNAEVEHLVMQRESLASFHIGATYARIARDGRYRNRYFGFGAALTRNSVTATFEGEHAEAVLEGMYLPTGTQLMDHFTVIDHAYPNCESHELYKGILNDKARAVFSGRIIVRPDAQKTNAKQSNNNLLLSDDARINTKPQLEIYADDVKCTHGATVGRLDDDALFYLRSRGIGEAQAVSLLSHAFASELVDRVKIEPLRETLNNLINSRLDRGINS